MSKAVPAAVVDVDEVSFPGAAGRPFDTFFSVRGFFIGGQIRFSLFRGYRRTVTSMNVMRYFRTLLEWRFRDVPSAKFLVAQGDEVLRFLDAEFEHAQPRLLGRSHVLYGPQRSCLIWLGGSRPEEEAAARIRELAQPTTVTVQLPPIEYVKVETQLPLHAPPPDEPTPPTPDVVDVVVPDALVQPWKVRCYLCAGTFLTADLTAPGPTVCSRCVTTHLQEPDGR